MDWLKLILALSLPVFVGAAIIDLLIPRGSRGRQFVIWGNGMLLGLFLTSLVMRLQDFAGLPLTFSVTAWWLLALLLLAIVVGRLHARHLAGNNECLAASPPMSRAQTVLFVLLAALILLRLVTLGLEVVWRPLFAWDATMHWATKARVWFAQGSIVPFVDNEQWLKQGGEGVFTDNHPAYPITIPLLQVWISSAIGRWSESLVNLPWLQCLVGLGIAFYGQARIAGATALTAIVFTYLLLSLPLLNTHVALAGYADIFMGACYCAAIMAFHNWSVTRQAGQGLLALAFALFCPMIKNEGLYWLLTFVPALIVMYLPERKHIILFVFLVASLLTLLLMVPPDMVVAGHSLQRMDFHYRPGALGGLVASYWVQDNWHLFAYLLLGLPLLCLLPPNSGGGRYSPIITALLAAVSMLLILFLFSRFAKNTERFTAVARISLHLVPSLMFLCLLLWQKTSARVTSRAVLCGNKPCSPE